jgi:hypothetical protein
MAFVARGLENRSEQEALGDRALRAPWSVTGNLRSKTIAFFSNVEVFAGTRTAAQRASWITLFNAVASASLFISSSPAGPSQFPLVGSSCRRSSQLAVAGSCVQAFASISDRDTL